MRLSGLAAGIATFAVLEITQNILGNWERIGPGPLTLSTVPADDRPLAGDGRRDRRRRASRSPTSSAPLGRKLRATREDPFAAQAAGIDVHRQRLWAFTLSGALAGFAGGLYVHLQSAINTDIYLDFTFLTLAMLVVGGVAQPVGRSRRRARGQRARLVPLRRRERLDLVAARSAPGASSSSSPRSWRSCCVFLPRGLTGGREFAIPRASSPRGGRSGAAPPRTAPRPRP